jgi:hypothetical protein
MAKQAKAEIGIFIMLARLERELVVRQEVVEPLGRVIHVRIARVFRRKVGRHPRQTRRIGREVKQGDRRPLKIRHLDAGGQKFRSSIVRRDLAPLHHVGKQQSREHLGDRADFENRVGIERAIGAGAPMDGHATPVAVDRGGDDPHGFAADIHPLFQDGGQILLRR